MMRAGVHAVATVVCPLVPAQSHDNRESPLTFRQVAPVYKGNLKYHRSPSAPRPSPASACKCAQQMFLTRDRVDIGDITDKNIESVKVKTVMFTTHKNMGGVNVAIARSCFEFQQPIVECPIVFSRA